MNYLGPQDDDLLFFDRGLDYLSNIDDIRTGLTNVIRSAASAMGSDCASLYLLRESAEMLEPYILINVPPEYLDGCALVPLGTQCCGRAALHKMPWAVVDMWTDPLFADCAEAARRAGMRSGCSVPILTPDDNCLGTLAVQFRRAFEPNHVDIARIRLFARIVSMAIAADAERKDITPQQWICASLAVGKAA